MANAAINALYYIFIFVVAGLSAGTRLCHQAGLVRLQEVQSQGIRALRESIEWGFELDYS